MKTKRDTIIGNRRFCYMIPPATARYNERGFIPAMVIEGEDGYRPMLGQGEHAAPWVWGPTREDAEQACKKMNELMGITEAAAEDIIASSMVKARRGIAP